MKNLCRFCAAMTLALTFTLPTFAGVITTGRTPPPPPEEELTTQETTTPDGQINPTEGAADGGSDSVIEAALNLLRSVLSLL